jgi:hypothetical protein
MPAQKAGNGEGPGSDARRELDSGSDALLMDILCFPGASRCPEVCRTWARRAGEDNYKQFFVA